jgi:putative protease
MSVSGRCVISNYLTGRDANRGECTQPCRWQYEVVEPHRPDKPMSVAETDDGTFLFNAYDMNMISHIAALEKAGISSFKIEGRAKAAYYVAITTAAYRAAVDGYAASGFSEDYKPEQWIIEELNKVSHRPYGTGFFFDTPHQDTQKGGYIREYAVVGVVEGYRDGKLLVEQRNRFFAGDVLDVLEPGQKPFLMTATKLLNGEGEPICVAPHAAMKLQIPFDRPLQNGSLLRIKLN